MAASATWRRDSAMEIVFLLFWLLFAMAVGLYATRKGRSTLGWFFFSLLLSPLLGFVFVAALGSRAAPDNDDRVPCPYCAEDIRPEAIKCPHCRTELGERWIPGSGR